MLLAPLHNILTRFFACSPPSWSSVIVSTHAFGKAVAVIAIYAVICWCTIAFPKVKLCSLFSLLICMADMAGQNGTEGSFTQARPRQELAM